MVTDLKILIGTRIRAAREAAGLSREQLAALIERTPEALGNIERGASLVPLDTLGSIGEALSIPLTAFLDTEGVNDLKRVELEARAYALIRSLDSSDAEFAVEFLEALKRRARKPS
ncbi:helix-turn-helix domain-containing protein [Microvirga sp. 2TAF3]|uniref:helix-turn-helix domain-containing protein n=1 Tax=Microvirga sp. 2TAF3 TaxID=3233014 RepID=UPI003F9E66F8